jgi:predicted phosphodiesterase
MNSIRGLTKQNSGVNQLRIAVMSDTHGNAIAFEAVINDMKEQSPDIIIFLGDIVMRGPQPT